MEGLEQCDGGVALWVCSWDKEVGGGAVVVEDAEFDRDAGDLDCGGRETRCLAVTVVEFGEDRADSLPCGPIERKCGAQIGAQHLRLGVPLDGGGAHRSRVKILGDADECDLELCYLVAVVDRNEASAGSPVDAAGMGRRWWLEGPELDTDLTGCEAAGVGLYGRGVDPPGGWALNTISVILPTTYPVFSEARWSGRWAMI